MTFGEDITSMAEELSKKGFFEIRPLREENMFLKWVYNDYALSIMNGKIFT